MKNFFKGKYGPLLIAEIGGNHEGDFEYAKKLTELAIDAKVDLVKFQIYSGDTLVSNVESRQRNEHFKKFELSKEQYIYLANMVKEAGIGFTSSVWDVQVLNWIDKYIEIYKIGSGDLTAYPVLRRIAKIGKPIILSTGLSTEKEIINSVRYIQSINPIYKDKSNLALLQCTSMYPINITDVNLNVMNRIKSITGLHVGYSDHTEGSNALKYAVAMGADILEFHFTDCREGKEFRDHKVSLTKDEVKDLITEIKLIQQLQGESEKNPLEIEIESGHVQSFRRAVYPSRNIKAGEILTEENLTVLRPNHGIDAREYENLLGRKVKINIQQHQKLSWEIIQ